MLGTFFHFFRKAKGRHEIQITRLINETILKIIWMNLVRIEFNTLLCAYLILRIRTNLHTKLVCNESLSFKLI